MLKRLERWVTAVALWQPPPWLWPAALVVLGVGAVVGSLLFAPAEGEMVTFLGIERYTKCSFQELTGHPCPSCGMTRSWVHTIRGHVGTGLYYSPAGATLLWTLIGGGVVGAVRLLTRDPRRLRLPPSVVLPAVLVWMIALYAGVWVIRLLGFMPLPAPAF